MNELLQSGILDAAIFISSCDDINKKLRNLKQAKAGLLANNEQNNPLTQAEILISILENSADKLSEYKATGGVDRQIRAEIDEIKSWLEADDGDYGEYNDILVRSLIYTIKVNNNKTITIYFKCGLEYKQRLDLKIRKLRSVS